MCLTINNNNKKPGIPTSLCRGCSCLEKCGSQTQVPRPALSNHCTLDSSQPRGPQRPDFLREEAVPPAGLPEGPLCTGLFASLSLPDSVEDGQRRSGSLPRTLWATTPLSGQG